MLKRTIDDTHVIILDKRDNISYNTKLKNKSILRIFLLFFVCIVNILCKKNLFDEFYIKNSEN